MRNLTELTPNEAKQSTRSIMDLTPFELYEADQAQRNNAGYDDNEGCDFENIFDYEN